MRSVVPASAPSADEPMRSRVAVLGLGGVGRALLELLVKEESVAAQQLAVVAVSDSKHTLSAREGHVLSTAAVRAVLAAKSSGAGLASVAVDAGTCQLHAGALVLAPRLLVADCSAADTSDWLLSALAGGASVALANKKPLCAPQAVFVQLTADSRRFRAESTVGAGLPVHTALRRQLAAGDAVSRVAGCFSGTLGVVCSGLQAGSPFSLVVRDAKEQGFTEPDPRDDLSGLDVARKALILARLLGWRLELGQVTVESLYPPSMGPDLLTTEQFMAALPSLDAEFAHKAAQAAADGCVLRYVATVENCCCSVGLRAVAKDSPLGRLQGTDNLVEVWSSVYDQAPFVIQGRGAGAAATASGVLADLLELRDCQTWC